MAIKTSFAPPSCGETYWEWQDGANCKDLDPGIFFPEGNSGKLPEKYDKIKDPRTVDDYEELVKREYCAGCEVQSQCLTFAIATNQDSGVWGNMTSKERRGYRRLSNISL